MTDEHIIILTPEQMKKLEDLPDDSPALRRMAEEWRRRRADAPPPRVRNPFPDEWDGGDSLGWLDEG